MAIVQTQTTQQTKDAGGVTLIDCDVHAQATEAMLAQHLGPWARAHLEHHGRRTPRTTDWYPRARNGGMRLDAWPDKPGHIWGSDPEMLRRQLLKEYDVDYAILEVLSGQDCYDHPDFARDWNHAINEWQLETWLEFDNRLRGTIAVAHEYPDLAVAEIERRAGDERFVAVLLPASAAEPLGSPKYWPIYRAATECGRPVVVHTGGYVDHRGAGYPSFYLEYHVGNGLVTQSQLAGMVAGGLFDEVPGVRIVLTESGIAWAAALRWSLDTAWEQMRPDHPRLDRRPSEYIDEHVWFTTQPIEEPAEPRHLMYAIEQARLGDRLLFATDYPHWDFDSPKQALPRVMDKEMRRAIMCGNALNLYGLPARREQPDATEPDAA
jgi:predicted TIM-barrel fold metal-dependent hydrolase